MNPTSTASVLPETNRRIFLSPPHMSGREIELIRQVFDSNYIAPVGPMLTAFEKAFADYIGIPHAVAVSSGTAAVHLALRCLDAGPDDEIWATTLTFIGSVGAAIYQGAALTFFDVDPNTWTLDPGLLDAEMRLAADRGKLPRAVIPTDLYGQSCDLDAISDICRPYGVPVIADSAEAVGARYRGRHAGAGAFAAVYSFNGNKIMTTSSGGMLASEDPKLIEQARYLSTQARDPVPHYSHTAVGYNYRMSNVLAAIGMGQLDVIEERVDRRRSIFEFYRDRLSDLPGVTFMPEADYGRANRWLTVMLIDPARFGADREAVRLALEAEDIEARPVWKPMHLQPVFQSSRRVGGDVAEGIFDRGLCLPSGSQLSEDELERIVAVVRSCARF